MDERGCELTVSVENVKAIDGHGCGRSRLSSAFNEEQAKVGIFGRRRREGLNVEYSNYS